MRVILLSLLILFTTLCNQSTLSNESYLEKNYEIINLNNSNNYSDLDILKYKLNDKEIILTGEVHGVKSNKKLEMKLMKYLKQKINIKYYLMETPYSQAYILNKYLETGDEQILKTYFKCCEDTTRYTVDEYNFIKELYEFNKQFDDNNKIQVVGVDIEMYKQSSYYYLKDVFGYENLPSKLKSTLSSSDNLSDLRYACLKFINEIDKNKSYYENILQEEFINAYNVLENIIIFCDANTNSDATITRKIREDAIYNNFKFMHSILDNGKYFGQFGNLHLEYNINMGDTENQKDVLHGFGFILRNDSQYKDKVLSISYAYNKCNQTYKLLSSPGFSKEELNYNNDDFVQYNDYDCYIFDINNTNSPFNKGSYLDYIVLFNNSDALEPLDIE